MQMASAALRMDHTTCSVNARTRLSEQREKLCSGHCRRCSTAHICKALRAQTTPADTCQRHGVSSARHAPGPRSSSEMDGKATIFRFVTEGSSDNDSSELEENAESELDSDLSNAD